MASGALPPAFAPVKIGSDYYWDGGIVSNTPLQHLLAQDDNTNCLVFQVDLFSAHGALPRTISDVEARHKEIMYSSRTRQVTDMFQRLQRWKTRAHRALLKVPESELTDEERVMLENLADLPVHTIIQLICQPQVHEGTGRDFEFSGASMREHWTMGHEDTGASLSHKDWLVIPPDNGGIVTYDVHRDRHR
jgi:NTE family protein